MVSDGEHLAARMLRVSAATANRAMRFTERTNLVSESEKNTKD